MSEHVELETLAAFAEGRLADRDATTVREHVVGCRTCAAAYADAVRYRAAWIADPGAFALDPGLRPLARRPDPKPPPSVRASGSTARVVLVAAAAGVAIATAGVFWTREHPATLDFALTPAVRLASERSSAAGLVLPGAARGADLPRPGMRAGNAGATSELRREVDAIVKAYEQGPRTADASAGVVAALLAAGEVDAARDYARDALRLHPDAVPLLVFGAEASVRANDLAGAEALLRRAAQRAPRDPLITLDLALVLRGLGRQDEMRTLLERAARSREAAIAARARRELLER